MADELVLGATDQLLRPDAIEDFGASNSEESGVVLPLLGPEVRPAGHQGEVVMRRLYVHGYHRAAVALRVTPVVDGRFRSELTAYLSKPATTTGRREAFSFLVPLYQEHVDHPGSTFGLRGTAFAAYLEMQDPRARVYQTGVTWAHEPLTGVRARQVTE